MLPEPESAARRCMTYISVGHIQPWPSSTAGRQYRNSADYALAGGVVGLCCLLLAQCRGLGAARHLALAFSEDRCLWRRASDQRCYFLCLVNGKIIFIPLVARKAPDWGGWSHIFHVRFYNLVAGHITCYTSSRTCHIAYYGLVM